MLSVLLNDVMSKIQCGELYSELFRCKHSKLQSHGLFALAKHLFSYCADTHTQKTISCFVASLAHRVKCITNVLLCSILFQMVMYWITTHFK